MNGPAAKASPQQAMAQDPASARCASLKQRNRLLTVEAVEP